jgi:SOS response regulatory protein OraA/RecX
MDHRPRFAPEDLLDPAGLAELALQLLRERARSDPELALRMRKRGIEPGAAGQDL